MDVHGVREHPLRAPLLEAEHHDAIARHRGAREREGGVGIDGVRGAGEHRLPHDATRDELVRDDAAVARRDEDLRRDASIVHAGLYRAALGGRSRRRAQAIESRVESKPSGVMRRRERARPERSVTT